MKKILVTGALLVLVPMLASAQNAGKRYRGQGYFFFAVAPSHASYPSVVGNQITYRTRQNDAALQFGGGGEWLTGHGVGLGGELLRSAQSFEGASLNTMVGSIDMSYHFGPSTDSRRVEPFVTGGYSFFYVPGIDFGHDNGANFGGGVNVWLSRHAALRLEIRDDIGGRDLTAEFADLPVTTAGLTAPYYLRSSHHLVGFRIGVTFR